MILSKDISFLSEYLEIAAPFIPDLNKLKRITSIHGRPNTSNLVYGQLWKYKNDTMKMSLYVNYYLDDKKKYYSTMEILCTFAHELSHLVHWNHSPDHKILECTLTTLFMSKLKMSGYDSEETEMRNIK
jgi:hypothetical protein